MTKEEALYCLKQNRNANNLWAVIEAFEGEKFYTVSGLMFTYTLNRGKKGITKELLIDRRKNSKSLAWSSIKLAFDRLNEMENEAPRPLVSRPKELGDIRGISYIYPMFFSFGLIDVPERLKTYLCGEMVEKAQ